MTNSVKTLKEDRFLRIKLQSSILLAEDLMASCPALSTPLYIFGRGNGVNEITSTTLYCNQTNGDRTKITLKQFRHTITDHLIFIHRRMVVPQSIYLDTKIFFG